MRKEWKGFLGAVIVVASAAACTGGEANKDQMAAGIDSLTRQRESTKARMDSAGIVHSDTALADSIRRDSLRRDSISRATTRP